MHTHKLKLKLTRNLHVTRGMSVASLCPDHMRKHVARLMLTAKGSSRRSNCWLHVSLHVHIVVSTAQQSARRPLTAGHISRGGTVARALLCINHCAIVHGMPHTILDLKLPHALYARSCCGRYLRTCSALFRCGPYLVDSSDLQNLVFELCF